MNNLSNQTEININHFAGFDNNFANPESLSQLFIIEKTIVSKKLLGVELYNDLLANKNAANANYTDANNIITKFDVAVKPEYEFLYRHYLLPYISLKLKQKLIPFLHYEIGQRGVKTHEGHNVKPVSTDQIKLLQDELQPSLNELFDDAEKYICDNINAFPLYNKNKCQTCTDPNTGEEQRFNKVKNFNGIILVNNGLEK